eukprot:TRINITY_DN3424_c1_g1_i1.p1 TRINITY_DN3424_c1_g1~~TRINITY_DN3424_c1_g1_i1.p1  ORF type:complete len:770 (-),score=77.93 TRINITY_DN3424_c1_g1_i1:40-2349(-)
MSSSRTAICVLGSLSTLVLWLLLKGMMLEHHAQPARPYHPRYHTETGDDDNRPTDEMPSGIVRSIRAVEARLSQLSSLQLKNLNQLSKVETGLQTVSDDQKRKQQELWGAFSALERRLQQDEERREGREDDVRKLLNSVATAANASAIVLQRATSPPPVLPPPPPPPPPPTNTTERLMLARDRAWARAQRLFPAPLFAFLWDAALALPYRGTLCVHPAHELVEEVWLQALRATGNTLGGVRRITLTTENNTAVVRSTHALPGGQGSGLDLQSTARTNCSVALVIPDPDMVASIPLVLEKLYSAPPDESRVYIARNSRHLLLHKALLDFCSVAGCWLQPKAASIVRLAPLPANPSPRDVWLRSIPAHLHGMAVTASDLELYWQLANSLSPGAHVCVIGPCAGPAVSFLELGLQAISAKNISFNVSWQPTRSEIPAWCKPEKYLNSSATAFRPSAHPVSNNSLDPTCALLAIDISQAEYLTSALRDTFPRVKASTRIMGFNHLYQWVVVPSFVNTVCEYLPGCSLERVASGQLVEFRFNESLPKSLHAPREAAPSNSSTDLIVNVTARQGLRQDVNSTFNQSLEIQNKTQLASGNSQKSDLNKTLNSSKATDGAKASPLPEVHATTAESVFPSLINSQPGLVCLDAALLLDIPAEPPRTIYAVETETDVESPRVRLLLVHRGDTANATDILPLGKHCAIVAERSPPDERRLGILTALMVPGGLLVWRGDNLATERLCTPHPAACRRVAGPGDWRTYRPVSGFVNGTAVVTL